MFHTFSTSDPKNSFETNFASQVASEIFLEAFWLCWIRSDVGESLDGASTEPGHATESSQVCVLRVEQEQVNCNLVSTASQGQRLVEIRGRFQVFDVLKQQGFFQNEENYSPKIDWYNSH